PPVFAPLPKPTALYSLADAFGNELLGAENALAAMMFAHWVDYADIHADQIDDLARIASLYGLSPRDDESVEGFRAHLKHYVRTFLDGTVTVQGIVRIAADALALPVADEYEQIDTWWRRSDPLLVTTIPVGDDAATVLFGVSANSVRGLDAQSATLLGS